MLTLGLIGATLNHSLSPQIHQLIFAELGLAGTYGLLATAPAQLGELVEQLALDYLGVNVTIPYKRTIMPFLTSVTAEAQAIGAVNTVHFEQGAKRGYNTDYFGFGRLLAKQQVPVNGQQFTVLGTGGAARAVLQYLLDQGAASLTIASRDPAAAAQKLSDLGGAARLQFSTYAALAGGRGGVIINCTPVGMYPQKEVSPVPPEITRCYQCAVDLIYNPRETLFLQQARRSGAQTANGLYMLVAQAVAAEEIWLGRTLDNDLISKIIQKLGDVR
ncbi:MAG: shikimate dehydrogenase [Acidaminococcaceae bacterium]